MTKQHIYIELFVPFCNNIRFATQLKWPKGVRLAGKFKALESILNVKFFWKVYGVTSMVLSTCQNG